MSGFNFRQGFLVDIAQSAVAQHAQEEAAKAAVEAARRIARQEAYGTETHYLKSGFEVKPGDYMNSIEARQDEDGNWYIAAGDFKSWWIEWGSVHNPKIGTLRRACAEVGLEVRGGPRGG